jgi:hypothetical protein
MDFLRSQLMERIKITALVNLFSLIKLPLLAFITPEFVEFTDEKTIVRVRLGYRTRNHLSVMYFGALAMGAELSVAGAAVDQIQKSGQKIDFLFKDFESSFLRRADGNVLFICEDAGAVRQLIKEASLSSDRLEHKFSGFAVVEGKDEPVMKYKLTLSVKNRSKKASPA